MQYEAISSIQNPTVKRLKKLLSSSKSRHEEGLVVAEGIHLAKSFVEARLAASLVVYAESAVSNPEVAELFDIFEDAETVAVVLKDSLFESISDIHAKVGILVVFEPQQPVQPRQLSTDAVLLENIQDPGNLGTLLRTAAAAGIKDIYLSAGSSSAWSPKTLRGGMGAQLSLRIYEDVDLVALVTEATVPVLATHLGDGQSLYEIDVVGETAWVFGSEGKGVSDELLAACSTRVTIPQADGVVESLNVSASAAVCLFEQRRQRLASGQE